MLDVHPLCSRCDVLVAISTYFVDDRLARDHEELVTGYREDSFQAVLNVIVQLEV
jgi:hypothetical protein